MCIFYFNKITNSNAPSSVKIELLTNEKKSEMKMGTSIASTVTHKCQDPINKL